MSLTLYRVVFNCSHSKIFGWEQLKNTLFKGLSNHDCLVLSIISSHNHIFSERAGLLACNYGFIFLKTTREQTFPEWSPFFPLHWWWCFCTEGVQNSPLRFKHKHQVSLTVKRRGGRPRGWEIDQVDLPAFFCCLRLCHSLNVLGPINF